MRRRSGWLCHFAPLWFIPLFPFRVENHRESAVSVSFLHLKPMELLEPPPRGTATAALGRRAGGLIHSASASRCAATPSVIPRLL